MNQPDKITYADNLNYAAYRFLHGLNKGWNHDQTHIGVNAGLNACVLVGSVPLLFLPYNKITTPYTVEGLAVGAEGYVAAAGIVLYLMLASVQQMKKNRERQEAAASVAKLADTLDTPPPMLPIGTTPENLLLRHEIPKRVSLKSKLMNQFNTVVNNSPMFKRTGAAELLAQAGIQSLLTLGAVVAIVAETATKGNISHLLDFRQPEMLNLLRITAASMCGVRANYLLAKDRKPYTFLNNPYLYVAGTFLAAGAVLPNDLQSMTSITDLAKLTIGDWVGLATSIASYLMYTAGVVYTWMASGPNFAKKLMQKLPEKLVGDHIPSLIFAAGCAFALVPNILNGSSKQTAAMACEFAMCLSLYALKTKDGPWEFLDALVQKLKESHLVQMFKVSADKVARAKSLQGPERGVPTDLASLVDTSERPVRGPKSAVAEFKPPLN